MGNAEVESLKAYMKLHKVKKRTAEPKNIEYRMSKDGIASLILFFKTNRTQLGITFDQRNL